MKLQNLLFNTLLITLFSTEMNAQSPAAGIRVTTTMHADDSRTVTRINSDTRTSEAITYDKGDKLKQKAVYKIDEQNQPISGMIYGPGDVLIMKATYKRDASNRLTEELDYTPDDVLLRRFVYVYDREGRLTKIDAFDAKGNPLKRRSDDGKTATSKSSKKKQQ